MSSGEGASNITASQQMTPKNIFYLDTRILTFAQDIVNIEQGKFVQLDPFKINDLNGEFRLQISRVTDDDIMITVIRLPAILPDPGYFVRYYISAIGLPEPPKCADMGHSDIVASVYYKVDAFRRKLEAINMPSYIWRFKLVVKMYEFTSLEGTADHEMAKILCEEMKLKYCKSERQLKDVLYLIGLPSFTDIFSGRQNKQYVVSKICAISRTFAHSKELAQYMKAVEKDGPKPLPSDIKVILNLITFDIKGPISNEHLIIAYFRAYRYGLDYLKVITKQLIRQNLRDLDFLTEVVLAADRVEDFELFNEASDIFVANLQTIKNSDKWTRVVKRDISSVESVFHALNVRLTSHELHIPSTSGEQKVTT